MHTIEITKEFKSAYSLLEKSNDNIFLTGKAGSGKSTLLKYFRENTVKNVVVLAPTGVAALNVQGQTIHSFFRFKLDITPEGVHSIKVRKQQREIYQELDVLVIDEVSMVRADILDCIDAFLRRFGKKHDLPFGGVQMIFFGDLLQLPPVVTNTDKKLFTERYNSPYFFDAECYKDIKVKKIELKEIYRQKDDKFINILNAIRNNTTDDKILNELNKRYDPRFVPDKKDKYIYLTTTNSMADDINNERLKALKTRPYKLHGIIEGAFEEKNLPTKKNLDLRFGAQVMLLNNDANGRWINGSIGRIVSVKTRDDLLSVINIELTNGEIVEVLPFTWEMYKFFFNSDTERVESEKIGSFTQYPIRLAWAITIHKSQGKTFNQVVLDIGRGTFAHGQVYVALSRCSKISGLILKQPILKNHIILDKHVLRFLSEEKTSKTMQ